MVKTNLTASKLLTLSCYSSTKVNFQFYFPVAG